MKKIVLPLSAVMFFVLPTSLSAQKANTTKRVPLLEVLTSSTCGPCKPGNEVFETVMAAKDRSESVTIKYQQDFPGAGDPYGTTESVERRQTYYGVTAIPNMQIDGGWDKNAQSFDDVTYEQFKIVPATYQLSGTYTLNIDMDVTARAVFTPLQVDATAASVKLYVAVVEKVTTKNVKSNGETAFYNVMKKMLPTETGIDVTGVPVGTQKSVTQSYKFRGAYRLPNDYGDAINLSTENSVENYKNLVVVGWLQGSNKQVYQAANFTRASSPLGVAQVGTSFSTYKVYPVPATNQLNVQLEMTTADAVSINLVSVTGQVVATQSNNLAAGTNQMTINTSNLAAGNYTMIIMDSESNVQAQMVTVAR